LDRDGDGIVTVDDIQHHGLKEYLGVSVHEEEKTLAKCVHSYADVTDSGVVTVDNFEHFCTKFPRDCRPLPRWHTVFSEPITEVPTEVFEDFKPLQCRDTELTELTELADYYG
jgi:hypothetical protein